jgi:hypothetical protein
MADSDTDLTGQNSDIDLTEGLNCDTDLTDGLTAILT